jgi:outer membrane cobalamin receptor
MKNLICVWWTFIVLFGFLPKVIADEATSSSDDTGIPDSDTYPPQHSSDSVEKVGNTVANTDEPQSNDFSQESIHSKYSAIVVAKRKDENVFTSNRTVDSIDKKTIQEMTPRSLPEALWNSPGVFVQQTNHGGGSPILRGCMGPQVLILVDGVRLNNSVYRTGPVQYLNLIDPFSVEKIEVLRGPGSVLYGSDAMGGVIQVMPLSATITRQPQIDFRGQAAGTFSSANRGMAFHYNNEINYNSFGSLLGVSYKDYNNLTGGGDVGEQVKSGYTNVSVIGNSTYHFLNPALSGWWLKSGYLFSRIDDAGRTDKLFDSNSLQIYDNDDGLLYAKLHGWFDPIKTSVDATISFQHFFERKDAHKMADDLVSILSTTRDDITVYTLGADLQTTTELLKNRLRLQYGGMFYRDWIDTLQKTRQTGYEWMRSDIASFPSGSTYDNYGVYSLLEGDPISAGRQHILRLSGGVRLHGTKGQAPARLNLPGTDFDSLGFVFLGGIQYLYKEIATTAFTFSPGFRAPNLGESVMLGDTGKYFHIPNAHLKPEESDTFEVLTRLSLGPVTLGVSGYVSLLADLIKREETTYEGQLTIDNKPVARDINGNEGILFGVEGQLGLDLSHGFSTQANLAYTRGDEILPDDTTVPLTRIPPLFGNVGLRYEMPQNTFWKGFVETYVRFARQQTRLSEEDEKDARIPEGGTPGWSTWNIAMGYTAWQRVQILLRGENLLNKKYKYHGSGIFGAGTNVILNVKFDY